MFLVFPYQAGEVHCLLYYLLNRRRIIAVLIALELKVFSSSDISPEYLIVTNNQMNHKICGADLLSTQSSLNSIFFRKIRKPEFSLLI